MRYIVGRQVMLKKYRRKELIVIKPTPLPCALNRGGSAANKTAETIMLITTTTPIPIIFS